jgi:carboxylesterase type B
LSIVEKFKQQEAELKHKRDKEKELKEQEELRKEKEKQRNMNERLRAIREKEEEAQRQIEAMRRANIKKEVKIQTPPKPKKPKVDPNTIKFNVTEMIRNRNNNSPSIVISAANKRVQSNIVKNDNFNFSSRQSAPRKKFGYLSAIGSSTVIDENLNKSIDSHEQTVDTNSKLPSLHKRLKKRLVEPLYMKATKQVELRRKENMK